MKVLERLVLSHHRTQVSSFLDPLDFAYQQHIRVGDTLFIYCRRHIPIWTRTTPLDFSNAFNTIQPLMLGEKMDKMQVDKSIIAWVLDYLSGRPQYVRLGACLSAPLVSII